MANDMNEQMCDLAQPTPLPAVTVPAMAYVPYQLTKQYEATYGPLHETSSNTSRWAWITGPWPWETGMEDDE